MHPDSWFQSWPSLHYLTIRSGPVRALERMVTLGQGLGLAMSLLSWVGGETFQDYRNFHARSNISTLQRSPPSTPWSPLLGLSNYSLLRQTHRCPGSTVGQFTPDQKKRWESGVWITGRYGTTTQRVQWCQTETSQTTLSGSTGNCLWVEFPRSWSCKLDYCVSLNVLLILNNS